MKKSDIVFVAFSICSTVALWGAFSGNKPAQDWGGGLANTIIVFFFWFSKNGLTDWLGRLWKWARS